jgi:antitoxin (DNA-binding transcriptional repressor) of toxin-antitoxin stability system
MSAKTIELSIAQARLAELVVAAARGEEVILTEDHLPRARLVALVQAASPRVAGLHRGSMTASEDFDRPLPDELWAGTE